MDIEATKLALIKWVTQLEDEEDEDTLNCLKDMKETSETSADWWDDLSESQKASIERGLKDLEAGRVTSHEDVKARYDF
jgi:hypothetical protein